MRRSEQEITKKADIEAVIAEAEFCRLGLIDGDQPYIVPLNFGYRDNVLYFHSAKEGKKMELIKRSPKVCVEFEANTRIIKAEEACKWATEYQSVIGFGTASIVDDLDEKREAFAVIMAQYSDKEYQISDKAINGTAIVKVEIDEMTGKESD